MLTTGRSIVYIFCLLVLGCRPPSGDVTAANKEVVREVYAVIDAQDYERLDELIAEDFVGHMVGLPEPLGKDETFELMREWYAAFPDYTHSVETMIAEGDRVAVRLTFRGTHRGEFEGIPATGNPFSNAGAHIVTVVDGAVTELWGLEDMLGLMTQLGMQLMPAEQATQS
jgi:steroid delta-isomerase-like uncharacterized protein